MQYSTHLLHHLRFTIGQNIHRHRSNQKFTLRKLARISGIPEWLLDQYELGKNDLRLPQLLRLACVLDVDVRTLLE